MFRVLGRMKEQTKQVNHDEVGGEHWSLYRNKIKQIGNREERIGNKEYGIENRE